VKNDNRGKEKRGRMKERERRMKIWEVGKDSLVIVLGW